MTAVRTYLDWNATAPLCPEARTAVTRALDLCGNASSVHAEGRQAKAMVDAARERVAALVGAKPSEVVFTSGATEACNTVLRAGWGAILRAGIEHDAVLVPAKASGSEIVALDVDRNGVVHLPDLSEKLRATAQRHGAGRTLLALQAANNETGVLQPLDDAAVLAHENGAVVFSDGVQAVGKVSIDFAALGLDVMALSAHKFGGPTGVGALISRDGLEVPALVQGGGQERRRRGGTENIPGIAGFGAAAEAALRAIDDCARIAAMRDRLEAGLLDLNSDAHILGAGAARLPNTICVALPGQAAETLVIRFDLAGIAVSAGAACSAGKIGVSQVLIAMGCDEAIARSAIRISIGPTTTENDIDRCLAAWREIAAQPSSLGRARTAA